MDQVVRVDPELERTQIQVDLRHGQVVVERGEQGRKQRGRDRSAGDVIQSEGVLNQDHDLLWGRGEG